MGGAFSKKEEVPRKFWLRGFYESGRTSIVYRLKHGKVCTDEMHLRFYGEEIETFEHSGEPVYAWDINGGRQPERHMTEFYFKWCESIAFVIDSANPENIEGSIEELNSTYFQNENLQSKVLMVVANKQDLENAISAQELEDKIKNSCKLNLGITVIVMPTSVETGEGLQLAFDYFWNLMDLKKQKLLKPGLLTGVWKKAEEQLATNNFDDVMIVTKKDLQEKKEKKKNHFFKAMKCILNY